MAWYKFTNVSEVLAASIIIALIMEEASTSETSVDLTRLHGATTQKTTIFGKSKNYESLHYVIFSVLPLVPPRLKYFPQHFVIKPQCIIYSSLRRGDPNLRAADVFCEKCEPVCDSKLVAFFYKLP
jgi:hypothetical protein